MLIIKSKIYCKFIIHFKIIEIVTAELQTAHRDIFDNNITVAVFLSVIDIGSPQICLLALSFTELEIDYEDILTCAFNFKFVLVSFKCISLDGFLTTAMRTGYYGSIVRSDICWGVRSFCHDCILLID